MLDYDIGADNVHVGLSDYVPWLTDRKWAYIRMEGSSGDVLLNVFKLEVRTCRTRRGSSSMPSGSRSWP